MKTKELIAFLQKLDPEAEVVIPQGNAMSTSPWPRSGEGFKSSWGYTLPDGYVGFSEAKAQGKTFPVVWL